MENEWTCSSGADQECEAARRVCLNFVEVYEVAIVQAEGYLEQVLSNMDPAYAQGYLPWIKALDDLLRGTYSLANHSAPTDPEPFNEALRLFRFRSGAYFLRDICLSCKIKLRKDWADRFKKDVDGLFEAYRILTNDSGHAKTF